MHFSFAMRFIFLCTSPTLQLTIDILHQTTYTVYIFDLFTEMPQAPEEPFDEKSLVLSVDLVEAARSHLVFLQQVDQHKQLYKGPHVLNAIRRLV